MVEFKSNVICMSRSCHLSKANTPFKPMIDGGGWMYWLSRAISDWIIELESLKVCSWLATICGNMRSEPCKFPANQSVDLVSWDWNCGAKISSDQKATTRRRFQFTPIKWQEERNSLHKPRIICLLSRWMAHRLATSSIDPSWLVCNRSLTCLPSLSGSRGKKACLRAFGRLSYLSLRCLYHIFRLFRHLVFLGGNYCGAY